MICQKCGGPAHQGPCLTIPGLGNGLQALENLANTAMEVPDVFGEPTGWRAWFIYQSGSMVRLASLHSGHQKECIWTPGQWMVSECSKADELHRRMGQRLPVEGCSCGFYAAIDRDHLVALGYNRYGGKRGIRVIGEVGMSGKVIEATQGWRAERVRPVSIQVPYEHWKLVPKLQEVYPSCEVTLANNWSREDVERYG